MSILTLKTDGTLAWDQNFPKDFLRFCYSEIGCSLITRVRLTEKIDMWVDDEGMYTQDVNRPATYLCRKFGYPADAIYGHAVISGTKWTDDGPEAGPLTEKQLYQVMNYVNEVRARL